MADAPAGNPLSRAVVALADWVRRHVPSAGVVYSTPTLDAPSAVHTIVTLAPPYVDYLGGESDTPGVVETTCTVDVWVPAAVLEPAVRTAEGVLWELGLMWDPRANPDTGTLGSAAAYAIPGETQMAVDAEGDGEGKPDGSVWVTVLHTVTVGVRVSSQEMPPAE